MKKGINQDLSNLVGFCLVGSAGKLIGLNVELSTDQALDMAAKVLLEAMGIPYDSFYAFVSITPGGQKRESVVYPGAVRRGRDVAEKRTRRKNIKSIEVVKSAQHEQMALPDVSVEVLKDEN